MRTLRRLLLCAPLLLLLLVVAGCNSENDPTPRVYAEPIDGRVPADAWSGFRGASHNGRSPELGFPIKWEAKNIRWSRSLPGSGNSSPIVWHKRVFVTAAAQKSRERRVAIGTSDRSYSVNDELVLICLDRSDGSIIWKRPVIRVAGRTHHKNGHASSTPATDGECVYVNAGSFGLFCFDFHGNQRWRTLLGDMSHQWGTASSPIVTGNVVIQLCDSERGSSIRAFNNASGKPLWQTPRVSKGAWSTPVLFFGAGGTPQVVVNGTGTSDGSPGSVISYAVKDGRELWRREGTSDIPCPTAIVDGRWIVSSSGSNGPILGIEFDQGPKIRWSVSSGGPYVPTGVIVGPHLYLISDGGVMTCRKLGDGELVWRQRLRDSFSASLISAEDRIYAVSERGTVYVVAASAKFKLLATNHLRESTLATPAFASGEIILRTAKRLHCIAKQ